MRRPRARATLAGLAVGVTLGLIAPAARADVDVELAVPAKVQGTLDAGEAETLRFFAPDGATLAAKLSTKKKAGVDVTLRLFDPAGLEVPIPTANITDKGSSIKVKKLVLGQTGNWAVRVSGDRAGAYKLALKTSLPKKLSFDVELAGEPVPLTVPAPRGATLKITAKTPRGGSAVPTLQSVDGEDVSQDGKRKDGLHKVTVVSGRSGDLVVLVAPDGGDGSVGVTVVVKPPKSKTVTQDLAGEELGRPAGGETVVGRLIEPEVGGVLTAGPASDIFGASVDVPPGAVSSPALLTLSSAPPQPISDTDSVGVGPTVRLASSESGFTSPVGVTLPFDLAAFPVQADADDLQVLQTADDGTQQIIDPISTDVDASTTSFQISNTTGAKAPPLSSLRFTVIAPAGSPPLAGRKYWGVAFDANLETDESGRDESGIRRVAPAEALLEFDPDGTSWTADIAVRELHFGLERGQGDGLQSVLDVTAELDQPQGTWGYVLDGRRVQLLNQAEQGEDHLFVSRDGSILLNATDEPDVGTPQDVLLDVFVERPEVADPSALLVGTYHMGEMNFVVNDEGGQGLSLDFLSSWGTLTFKANGTLNVDVTHVEAVAQLGPNADPFEYQESKDRGNTRWSVDPTGGFAGTVLIDDGDGGSIRVFPHRDGRMFVAMQSSGPDEKLSFIVGVRKSAGSSVADLDGPHAMGTCFFEPIKYEIEDGPSGSGNLVYVPDFELSGESSRLLFDGAGGVTLSPRSGFFQMRDPQVLGGVRTDTDIGSDFSLDYTVSNDGRFEIVAGQDELRGGVTGDSSFGFVIQDPDAPRFGLILFVDRPPQQQ